MEIANGVSIKVTTVVEKSGNSKIGIVSATYATQKSCPDSCEFKGHGCYAETGRVAFTTRRLNNAAEDAEINAREIAEDEASKIDALTGKHDLRVHVVGDCKTNAAAQIISDAMRRHRSKFGMKAWTYTHAWKPWKENVARASWGSESVLASCKSIAEVRAANELGYAAAIVVPSFERDTAYEIDGEKVIPCPQQTGRQSNCSACGLCMNDVALRAAKASIAFRPDKGTTAKIQSELE